MAARHAMAGLRPKLAPEKALESLSPQELRVLQEVAAALGLQTKTVRNYLDRVFEKLAVNTRTQAALLYDRHIRKEPETR